MKETIVVLIILYALPSYTKSLQKASHEAFQAMYNSCDAIDAPIINKKMYSEIETIVSKRRDGRNFNRFLFNRDKKKYHYWNPVLRYLKENTSNIKKRGCASPFQRAPIYAYGGTPIYKDGKLSLTEDLTKQKKCHDDPGNGSICRESEEREKIFSEVSGTDCSAFVSTVFAMAGVKMSRSQTKSYYRYTTTSIDKTIRSDPQSCIVPPLVDVEGPILSGDIINLKGMHVVLVDEVGEDPFGIEGIIDEEDCDDIMIDDFNFSIIHSSSTKNMGLQRSDAGAYFGRDGMTFRSNLEYIAGEICRARLYGEDQIRIKYGRWSKFTYGRATPKARGCSIEAVPLTERECIRECVE